MSPWHFIGWGLVALVGLAGSSVFSGLETGLYRVSRVRLRLRASGGKPGRPARMIQKAVADPDSTLGTLLIGNNVCNYLGVMGVSELLLGLGLTELAIVVVTVGVLTPVLFVLGEAVPKEIFRIHADDLTLRLARVLVVSRVVFTAIGVLPLIRLFAWVISRAARRAHADLGTTARERVALLVKEGGEGGALSRSQAELIDRAVRLGQYTVADLMVPMSRAAVVGAGWPRGRVISAVERGGVTRVPVLGEKGEVVGILNSLDLFLDPGARATALATPAPRLRADGSIRDALRALQREGCPMGVVYRDSRAVGIVTQKDLVEPLTGKLLEW